MRYIRITKMPKYIHELPDWPKFRYDAPALIEPTAIAARKQGLLFGRLDGLGFGDLQDAKLDAISLEVTKSSEIEGERLDPELVRSSIARRLGMDAGGVPSGDHHLEGVVEMALDASEHAFEPLTQERLFTWHAGLFPGGRGPMGRILVGAWRDDAKGPMQVVSGAMGRERVHFEAPAAKRLPKDMRAFLKWFDEDNEPNWIIKAGLAHLWFVTIHPFDDGNGRIGRAILDMGLARADERPWRCYSVSAQIRKERAGYYAALERSQRSSLDATDWLLWYVNCLGQALDAALETIAGALARSRFWQRHSDKALNERQRKVLSRMLMGLEGKMTSSKWATMAKCSAPTAVRDLNELIEMRIIARDEAGGRSAAYHLASD